MEKGRVEAVVKTARLGAFAVMASALSGEDEKALTPYEVLQAANIMWLILACICSNGAGESVREVVTLNLDILKDKCNQIESEQDLLKALKHESRSVYEAMLRLLAGMATKEPEAKH